MNGAETSRVQGYGFDSKEPSAERDQISSLSDESQDSKNIVHRPVRMVRKFPEEAEDMPIEHRHSFEPLPETTCVCPEVLSKGTLVAIVAALAILGFFSTLLLLLVAVIVLRMVEKQRKKDKKGKKDDDVPPKRPIPPVPRRPSEHIYLMPKESPYKKPRPVSETEEAEYLDPKELNPGPRLRQEPKHTSPEGTGVEDKLSGRESSSSWLLCSPALAVPMGAFTEDHSMINNYRSTPENAYTSMQPAPRFSVTSPEHVYASILPHQAERSYADTEPQPESMADASATEEQKKGPEEHFYEEIN